MQRLFQVLNTADFIDKFKDNKVSYFDAFFTQEENRHIIGKTSERYNTGGNVPHITQVAQIMREDGYSEFLIGVFISSIIAFKIDTMKMRHITGALTTKNILDVAMNKNTLEKE